MRTSLGRRLVTASVAGALTFASTTFASWTFVEALILALLAGSIVLLTQFMLGADDAADAQRAELRDINAHVDSLVRSVDAATGLWTAAQESALDMKPVVETIKQSGRITAAVPAVARSLADHEISRLNALLTQLATGNEIFYDGEDREWLIGLTSVVQQSISAVSVGIADSDSEDAGPFRQTDLGFRYLELQRQAVFRGVRIRRVMAFPQALPEDAAYRQLIDEQANAGVDVRVLSLRDIPAYLRSSISDHVVFDSELVYEQSPATHTDLDGRPAIISTRLTFDKSRVAQRSERFEELWTAARAVHPRDAE